jgi:hypothetical protein
MEEVLEMSSKERDRYKVWKEERNRKFLSCPNTCWWATKSCPVAAMWRKVYLLLRPFRGWLPELIDPLFP